VTVPATFERTAGDAPAPTVPPARRRTALPRLPRWARILLLLTPALLVVVGLFLGGLVLGALQSLGYQPYLPGWSWTLEHYRTLADDRAVQASIVLTFRIATLATVVSAVLAVGAALLIRSTRRGRRLLTVVFQSTLPVPHVVGAVAMLLLLSQSGFVSRVSYGLGLTDSIAGSPQLTNDRFGFAILAEYVWKETAFIGVVVLAALSGALRDLEDVARTLGASAWQRFRHVTLPLITPGVLSTSVIVFAFTFGSYEVPFLLGRPFPTTLPVVAYQQYVDTDLTARPQAMAISMLIALVVGLLVVAYMRVTERVLRKLE
jgi:putative spermidine/putrescine transport system permease protein